MEYTYKFPLSHGAETIQTQIEHLLTTENCTSVTDEAIEAPYVQVTIKVETEAFAPKNFTIGHNPTTENLVSQAKSVAYEVARILSNYARQMEQKHYNATLIDIRQEVVGKAELIGG